LLRETLDFDPQAGGGYPARGEGTINKYRHPWRRNPRPLVARWGSTWMIPPGNESRDWRWNGDEVPNQRPTGKPRYSLPWIVLTMTMAIFPWQDGAWIQWVNTRQKRARVAQVLHLRRQGGMTFR
jgi:hypothetical protein